MIPLLHDFSNATVLVFGGGPVGARKARRFAHEARVVVISPTFDDADFGDAEKIRALPEPERNAIEGWFDRFDPMLVVAATDDDEVNDALLACAQDRNVLVNRADRSGGREPGSVVVPATVRADPVVLAIATGGTAPALSKYLREAFEDHLDGAGEMATVVAGVRTELQARDVPWERRREILTDLVESPDVWTTLRTGTVNTRQVIEDVLAEELPTEGEQS